MTLFLTITAILGPSLGFVAGAALAASRYQRRLRSAHEYADGCLRTASQAETWGFKRGYDKGLEDGRGQSQLEAIARGMNLRDQIDEIGDYSQ